MKKGFIFVLMAALVIFGFVSCNGSGTVPEPTPEPEVPPTFQEVINGKFWTLNRVERYQDTGSARMADPYALDVCAYWDENGEIWFYVDENEDGIISPSEPVSGPISWDVVDDKLIIEGMEWLITYFNDGGWAIEADASGTELGEILENLYGDWDGWIRLHYVPCLKAFDGDVLEAGFAFVFDDLNDTMLVEVPFRCHDGCKNVVIADIVDGFAFDFGEQRVIIGNFDVPCYTIETTTHVRHGLWNADINTDWYGFVAVQKYDEVEEEYYWQLFGACEGFLPNHVYDMTMSIDSADWTAFDFVSRWDDSAFSIEGIDILDRDLLGAVEIVAVNDVDVPVVNP